MILPEDGRPVFVTADQHFDHKNIIQYASRPFSSVEKMNRAIVANHNETVPEEAVVFHLGDFTMVGDQNRVQRWLNALHGEKHLILGNHDRLKMERYIDIGFTSVHTTLYMEKYNIYFAHDISALSGIDRTRLWVGGHVHDLFLLQKNALNVGIDMWNYHPVPISHALAFKEKMGGKK